MAKLKITPALIENVAGKFSEVLREWLTPEQMNEVVEKNKHYGDSCCASHDYCDANMAMDEAFTSVVGFEINLQSNKHCLLWGEAWELAKANDFKFIKTNLCSTK